ncbi:hypothetical protein EST38_g6571 [Candolleomyces aberdarensis]|uniref:Beta-lactamase-related domain-containing protein n=1 Tax=Candolleomyces aberdarensis TaxID=2316362 RepID=A0A4Q2DJB7_9AGAR|nr:hypothetical protein EST38_g6571 [Candolleomyces aberdarensis]
MVKFSAAGKKALDDLIAQFQAEKKLPGFGIVVTSVDRELYASAGGFRVHDDPTSGAVTPDSLYWICSMAKLITALACLVLIEQGKLNFDDPVTKYLPQFNDTIVLEGLMTTPTPKPRLARGVPTILHLLSHSSGSTYFAKRREPVYSLGKGYTFEQTDEREQAQDEFLDHIKEGYSGIPLAADPGTSFSYGYSSDILGIIIARVAGQSLEDFCEQHIFEPVGIKTTFRLTPELIAKLVELSFRNEDGSISRFEDQIQLIQRYPKEVLLDLGGIGGYSTFPDYATLLRHLLRIEAGKDVPHPILKQESVKTLFKPQLTEAGAAALAAVIPRWDPNVACAGVNWSTGLALTTSDLPGKRKANSAFWFGWAGTLYVIDPTTGIAIVAGSQIIPTFDRGVVEMFEKVEGIVYANLEDD